MLFFREGKALLYTMEVNPKNSEIPEVWPNTLTRKVPKNLRKKIVMQDSTITIKSPYGITYICQNFGVREVLGLIPKSIYQAS